ncbi:MAG: hypothetical protein WAK16_10270 [Candidatus Cybelea sp.]
MRRFPIELLILVVAVVTLVVGWRIYGFGEMGRFGPAIRAQKAPSELYARLIIRYPKPPIAREEYRVSDIEGVSAFSYTIRGYDGRQITINAPAARIYDVSFFVGRLDQDGVWQIVDRDPLPHADAHYTVYVKQVADYKQGDRTVTFTDPHYWATKTGRLYTIDLSKGVPNDLVHMSSTQVADPRYEQIVKDFRDFGPDEFRHNVAVAQGRIRGSHG